jgi:hypothetical protein
MCSIACFSVHGAQHSAAQMKQHVNILLSSHVHASDVYNELHALWRPSLSSGVQATLLHSRGQAIAIECSLESLLSDYTCSYSAHSLHTATVCVTVLYVILGVLLLALTVAARLTLWWCEQARMQKASTNYTALYIVNKRTSSQLW